MRAVSSTLSRSTSIRIQNPRLLTASRVIWIALAALSAYIFLIGLPLTFDDRINQAVTLFSQELPQLGLSNEFYAHYFGALQSMYVLVSLVIAGVIFWKRSDDWVALLVSLELMTFSVNVSPLSSTLAQMHPEWTWPVILLDMLSKMFLLSVLYVFPDGRFRPLWTRWLLIPALLTFFGSAYLEVIQSQSFTLPVFTLLAGVWAVSGLVLQIYRYRHYSTPSGRQQTKWVIYGMMVAIVPIVLFLLVDVLVTPWLVERPMIRLIYRFVVNTFFIYVPLSALPISIGLAALRYRLWDIDLAANRSLVYGSATAILGLIFAGAGLLLLNLVGSDNVLLAFSLPAVAAVVLFRPIRHQIQGFIDHRLYGLRFDLDEVARAQKIANMPNLGTGYFTGQVFGKYDVMNVIGQGGMGMIYRGYDRLGDADVAIKTLTEFEEEEAVLRFEREARAVTALQHPNIVKVFDYKMATDLSYMVMEYIDGVELREYIRKHAPLSLKQVQHIISEIAAALDYIHAQGMVHRDIKPSNIMLHIASSDLIDRVVLMDFGIAKTNNDQLDLTSTNALGTIDYMAPEQIRTSTTVDQRADIYALGVVLFEMLTCERPFKGSGPQVLFAHLQQPPPNPRSILPDIPVETSHVVLRALSKDPDDRYQSAGEMAAALR